MKSIRKHEMFGFAGLGPPTPEQREYQKKLAASGLTGSPFEAAPEACRNASMNVIEEMAQERESAYFSLCPPELPDEWLIKLLGDELRHMARLNSHNCPPEVTRALAAYQTWEASRR